MTKIFLTFAVAAAAASAANAAVSFTGTTITENFNGLPTLAAGTVPVNGNAPTQPFSATVGVQAAVPGTVFDAAKTGGTGATAMPFSIDTGSLNSGAIYSYGATVDAPDRALGSLASGSNVPAFGVAITNNAASDITSITITLNAEAYRSSTAVTNVLNAQYLVGAAGSSTYLTTVGTDVDALDIVGPTFGATNGAITPTSTPLTATFAVSVPVGQSFYLRFFDTNETGNDAGLAADDFTFSAVTAGAVSPEPTTLAALAGIGLVGCVRRRRA